MIDLDTLDFEKGNGLVTVVTQDAITGDVLMIAFADREAMDATVRTGEMHYRSRTRGLWHKGATSGNTQRLVSLTADCDTDAVLALVIPEGPACHTGAATCFTREGASPPPPDAIAALDEIIDARAGVDTSPRLSYTRRLLDDRNLRMKKLGEEAAELVLACADGDAERATGEAADLIYHTLVALRALGIRLDDVREELARRSAEG
ncbi:MAG: bifunctional phosphoribosyl-AMP cyclohydrolase/phosphoribosyl-ATP diphosphatase HisIE [Gemmatimonadaceae bacterium]|nr:bifunctional phosphoribosyl-AMP cyclohydrolase/phosphoribosyl-ATP diphosphatase HisIE [Gemmatimonadaceae bacterium]